MGAIAGDLAGLVVAPCRLTLPLSFEDAVPQRIPNSILSLAIPALSQGMIQYDPHALFQMARRGILKEWVEAAIQAPEEQETRGDKRSFLKCHADRGKMLRVVARLNDPEYVITAYFDRRKPCA